MCLIDINLYNANAIKLHLKLILIIKNIIKLHMHIFPLRNN